MWDENRVRIVDVADQLGVSTATVSNVLHGKTKKISDGTVKRVQEKLVEMGYIPNMAATLLAQNDSRIVGVVVNDHPKYEGRVIEDPFICSALNALTYEIDSAGCFMMVKQTKNIADVTKYASMWNMDGLILIGFCADEYQSLRDKIRIPFVVYDGFFENDRNICNLILDDFDGGRQVGAFLRGENKKKVLCISDNKLLPDYDRYRGLCKGLGRDAGFMKIPMEKRRRLAFYRDYMADFRGMDAVFCVSDYYAIELMNFLIGNGMQVPDDIWVIGFDDIALCRSVTPTLSSVRQDVNLRSEKAVRYIGKMREDRAYSKTEKIPVTFIPRMSCGREDEDDHEEKIPGN